MTKKSEHENPPAKPYEPTPAERASVDAYFARKRSRFSTSR